MKYFLKIFLSLLLCVLLPSIVPTALAGKNYESVYEENMAASQMNRLKLVDNTNSIILQRLDQDASRMASTEAFSELGGLTSFSRLLEAESYPSKIFPVYAEMDNTIRNNGLIASMYVYVDSADYVITSSEGVMKLEDFADRRWLDFYGELMDQGAVARLFPSHAILSSYPNSEYAEQVRDHGRSCLTYICPITPYNSTFWGAIVFNIYEDELQALYDSEDQTGEIAIFNMDEVVLSTTKPLEDFPQEDLQEARQEARGDDDSNGYQISGGRGSRTLYSWYSSGNGLSYLGIQDVSTLSAQNTSFQVVLNMVLAALIAVGSLGAFFLSRRLYQPIGKLYKEVTANNPELDLSGEKDAVSGLSKAFEELLREERRLFSTNNREKLLEAAFRRLLSGEYDPEDADMRRLLPDSCTTCVVIEEDLPPLEEGSAPAEGEVSADGGRQRLLIHMCCEALAERGITASGYRQEYGIAALLLSTEDPIEVWQESMEEALCKVQEEFRNAFGISITVAVSDSGLERTESGRAYRHARRLLPYRFIKGNGKILYYRDFSEDPVYYSAADALHGIAVYLEKGQGEKLSKALSDLFADLSERKCLGYSNVMQILNQLVSDLVQYTMRSHIRMTEFFEDESQIYHQLWTKQTLSDVQDWLIPIYNSVMEYQSNQGSNMRYANQAMEYAKQNFSEGITIDSIAQQLGISYSYLRRVFKAATGQNLVDYLNTLRLDQAKKLLLETDLTIREISAQCGYNHERSFSRAFLQSEKMTPGKFREANRPLSRDRGSSPP